MEDEEEREGRQIAGMEERAETERGGFLNDSEEEEEQDSAKVGEVIAQVLDQWQEECVEEERKKKEKEEHERALQNRIQEKKIELGFEEFKKIQQVWEASFEREETERREEEERQEKQKRKEKEQEEVLEEIFEL